jgi:hypothetical protein
MARQIAHTGVLALALCSTGCTSILGDFTEGPALDGGALVTADTGARGDDAEVDVEPHQDAATGQDGAAQVDGAQLVEADLVDAAADTSTPDADAAPVCLTTLSGVGASDFRIAFTLTTTETGLTLDLLNQRAGCTDTSAFWDITLSPTAGPIATTGDGTSSSVVTCEAGNSLNDGQPHAVVVGRTGGSLWYSSDGVVHSPLVPDAFAFGTFPALTVGSDACSGNMPFAGHGTISDVCLTIAP